MEANSLFNTLKFYVQHESFAVLDKSLWIAVPDRRSSIVYKKKYYQGTLQSA